MNKMKKMRFFEIYSIVLFFHFTNSKTELDRFESCCKHRLSTFTALKTKRQTRDTVYKKHRMSRFRPSLRWSPLIHVSHHFGLYISALKHK